VPNAASKFLVDARGGAGAIELVCVSTCGEDDGLGAGLRRGAAVPLNPKSFWRLAKAAE